MLKNITDIYLGKTLNMSLLYLISPPNINFDQFPDLLAAIFAESNNSIGAFQLRVKNRSVEDIFDISKILLPICKSYNIDYYINDHYKIADKLEIDGIHLGQNDGNIVKICQTYGRNFKIGISCMNSIELAFKAQKLGVNYVSFGAFFPTNTKKYQISQIKTSPRLARTKFSSMCCNRRY